MEKEKECVDEVCHASNCLMSRDETGQIVFFRRNLGKKGMKNDIKQKTTMNEKRQ